MSTLLDVAEILIVVFDVFFLPGYGITRRFVKTDDSVEVASLSLAIGLFCGSVLYFVVAAVFHLWMTPLLVLVVANLINLVHLPVIVRDVRSWLGRRSAGAPLFPLPDRRSRWVLVLALATVVLSFVRYDKNSFFLHCANFPVAYVTGITMGDGTSADPDRNEVLALPMEEREGNPALVAASPALFQFLGYRVFYALEHLVLVLVAFLLGEMLARNFRAGILLALLFGLQPTLLSLAEMDQNKHTLVASVVALYLLMRTVPSPLLAGVFFGLAFGCRHILLPGIVGPIGFTLGSARRFRNTALFLLGFSIPSVVWAFHHWLAFGAVFHHESFMHIPQPVAHSLLGFRFDLPYIFEWPLVPELLRSPFTGFPQALLLPLTFVRDFGTVLSALALFGAVWMFFNQRRQALLLFGFMVPVYLILMIQGNWSEEEKLRFVINIYAPFVLCIWAALVFLARRGRRFVFLAATLVASLGLSFATQAADGLRFPVDARQYDVSPAIPKETDVEYEIVRREFVTGSLLPRELIQIVLPLARWELWRQALYEVSNRRYEDQTETIHQAMGPFIAPALYRRALQPDVHWRPADAFKPLAGEPVVLRLDLSDLATRLCSPIRVLPVPSPAALDMTTRAEPAILANRKVPFSENAVDVVVLRLQEPDEAIFVVLIMRPPGFYPDPPVPFSEPHLDLAVNGDANMMMMVSVSSVPIILFTWQVPLRETGPEATLCAEASKG